jgi:hypothetical protein
LTVAPFQNALHDWGMFMLEVTVDVSQVLFGRWLCACAIIWFSSKKPERDACVLPAPPKPGVVQSVPPLVPKSRLPAAVRLIGPHWSAMSTYCPLSVEVMSPSTQVATLPPMSLNRVEPPMATSAPDIGQPACSTPSGTAPSFETGNTPPITWRVVAAP